MYLCAYLYICMILYIHIDPIIVRYLLCIYRSMVRSIYLSIYLPIFLSNYSSYLILSYLISPIHLYMYFYIDHIVVDAYVCILK